MLRQVGVVGAGDVGQGIVRTLAQAEMNVIFKEVSEEKVEEALTGIKNTLSHEINRWGLTGSERAVILSRIRGTTKMSELQDVELTIEAIIDDWEQKQALFEEMDRTLAAEMIFTTNTSTLSITELARLTKRPDRFCGMHFFSPVHKRPLVEVVRGMQTSDETFGYVSKLVKLMGKTGIEVFEAPGFVTTRTILPFINEAMTIVMEGTASANDVDTAMKLAYNLPQGPLELADTIGLDHIMVWNEQLLRELGEAKYRPCMLLRKLVRAGHFGVKTQQGFFRYDHHGQRIDEDERDQDSPYSLIPKN